MNDQVKSLKILVTGASGFIGQHVVNTLVKYPCELIATSRNIEKAKRCSWYPQVKYIPFEIGSPESANADALFGKPDVLIHLAWNELSDYGSRRHFERNLPDHYRFLKKMIQGGLRHLVVAGTCLEYGLQNGPLVEDMQTLPANPYGLAKDTLHKFLEHLVVQHPIVLQWIRLFYLTNGDSGKNTLFSQLNAALERGDKSFNMSGGEQIRDYLPVETAAAYIVKIAMQTHVAGPINCCSGQPISVRNLVEKYLRDKNAKISLNLGYFPYPGHEPFAFWGDVTKLRAALG